MLICVVTLKSVYLGIGNHIDPKNIVIGNIGTQGRIQTFGWG